MCLTPGRTTQQGGAVGAAPPTKRRERTLSTLYEAKQWGRDEHGKPVLVRVVAWDIGQLMTRHREDCRVREELRRSARTATPAARRLELAQTTACTCGAREHEGNIAPIETTSHDRRDNRDPEEVGLAHLRG